MTITSQAVKVVANGNGATTVFSYAFLIPDASSVSVIYTDLLGNQTTLTPAQYSITGLGSAAGGTVTYPLVGSPIATGTTLTIARVLSFVQLRTIANQSGFYAGVVDGALDYITMLLQQVNESITRTLQAPLVDPSANLLIPSVANRKNQLLAFDSLGNAIAGQPSSAVVSSAMQAFVNSASIAAARTVMGLGVAALENIGAGLADDGSGNLVVRYAEQAVSTSQAPTSASNLKRYSVTGSVTFTMPRANTLFDGFGMWIDSYTGVVTVAIDSHDNIKGSTSAGTSITIPAGWSIFLYTDAATAGTWFIIGVPLGITGNGFQSFGQQCIPGGRLTITSGSPVIVTETTAQTTVYYTPYAHSRIPIWNGTQWISRDFTELSQLLSDATKSPAAAVASSCYDLFVWDDAGTLRLSRGPVWTNITTRAMALSRQNGIWVNGAGITNGPGSGLGTYVGTICTDSNTQLNMQFTPAAAAGGSNNRLDVWNAYNRIEGGSVERDSTDSWTYGVGGWRAADNNVKNRISFVRGLNEDAIFAQYFNMTVDSGGIEAAVGVGIGLDSTGALASGLVQQFALGDFTSNGITLSAMLVSQNVGVGQHFVQALEYVNSGASNTFFGDDGAPAVVQSGLVFRMMM